MTITSPNIAHRVPYRELAKEVHEIGLDAGKTGPDSATDGLRPVPKPTAAISHTRNVPPALPSRSDEIVREVMRRTRKPLHQVEYNPCPMIGPDWWGRK